VVDLQPAGSTLEPLSGGTTNRSWRVLVDGRPVSVLRVPASDDDLLGIDRATERRAARQAAAAELAPPVLATADSGAMLIGWVENAAPMRTDALLDPAFRLRLCETLRQLHSGPLLRRQLDHAAVQRRFLAGVRDRELAFPPGYDDLPVWADQLSAVLKRRPQPAVPCHNDLSAGNVLDDSQQLWLIDFEYAADAEPAAELGNAIGMSALPNTAVEPLVTAYRGEPDQLLTDRAVLYHALSIVTWIPWLILQAAAHPDLHEITDWIDLDVRAAHEARASRDLTAALARLAS
jgi:thiamine kinase-like enzyme